LLYPVGGEVAVDCDRKKKGRWRKNRPGFESGHGTTFEALTGIKTHWRKYEAA
jgi:hypothetical protein